MIDVAKCLEALRDYRRFGFGMICGPDKKVAVKDVIEVIEGLEDHIRDLAKMVPKWISVEERLPENEKAVLIATKWSCMGMRGTAVSCGFYTNGKTFTGDSDYNWDDGDVDLGYDEEEDEYIVPEGWWEGVRFTEHFSAVDDPVTHWMPLPEPPNEG